MGTIAVSTLVDMGRGVSLEGAFPGLTLDVRARGLPAPVCRLALLGFPAQRSLHRFTLQWRLLVLDAARFNHEVAVPFLAGTARDASVSNR